MINTALVTALVGLIVVITVHIVVIARWSGRIDGYIASMTENIRRLDNEVLTLRTARHEIDGRVQRHEAAIRQLENDHRPWERRAPWEGQE